MIIRRYTKEDVPLMVKHLEEGLQQFHYKNIYYDANKVRDTLNGNLRNSTFVCYLATEDDGTIMGAIAGYLVEYPTSREVFAQDLIYFMRKGHSSLKAARALVEKFVAWGKSKGCREVRVDQSTGYKIDKFAHLLKRWGFEPIGSRFRMELTT